MTGEDGLEGDGLLLSRIALVERRLLALTRLVLESPSLGPARAHAADSLPACVVIEPDSLGEFASGFHERELDASGNPFRWAGRADHFEFRCHLDRLAARPFRMLGQFAPGVAPELLRGYVDYRPIPIEIERDGAMAAVVGRIPADPLGGATTLTFRCPAIVPRDSADRRRLSFAFVRLVAGAAPAVRAAA